MLKGNAMVGQSGGPTSVINASLAGVIYGAVNSSCIDTIYGAEHGIEGVLAEQFMNLSERFSDSEQLELLKNTPAAYLGSCRKKLPNDLSDPVFPQIFEIFKKHNVAYFFYIGGNDSMDTVDKLSAYAKTIDYPICIIGIPKTIDNDLAVTDHCPGFGSAAKYIAASMREIVRDSVVYPRETVTIVEIMGRNAGWLAASAALARTEDEPAPHLIYLPELVFDTDQFVSDVEAAVKKYTNAIVVVSEGVKTADGKYVCEAVGSSAVDSFGHKQLSGTAATLANLLTEKFGWKIRSIELSLLQRCAAHLASATDNSEAFAIGRAGVEAAVAGNTAQMMYYDRVSENPYRIEIKMANVCDIANVERKIPREWINEAGNDVLPPCLDYMRPLIQGEVHVKFKDGLPVYAKR